MVEQYDNGYNNVLIAYSTPETIEHVLKIILTLSPFFPLSLLNVNGHLIPLLVVSTHNITTNSEFMEIPTSDTIRKLSSTLEIIYIYIQPTTRSFCSTFESRSQA